MTLPLLFGLTTPVRKGVGSSVGASTVSGVGVAHSIVDDPYWPQTLLLCHFDETFGPNYLKIVDEAGHTFSTATKKRNVRLAGALGGYAFAGRTDQLAYIDGLSSEFNGFSASDYWTIEFRLRLAYGATNILFTLQGTSGKPLQVGVNSNDGGATYNLWIGTQGESQVFQTYGGITYFGQDDKAYQWNNVVIENSAAGLKVVIDGVVLGGEYTSSWVSGGMANAFTLYAGQKTQKAGITYGAKLDEMRITKAARYGGSGFPSAIPVFPDARQIAEGVGSTLGEAFASAAGAGGDGGIFVAPFEAVGSSAGSANAAGVGRQAIINCGTAAGSSQLVGVSSSVVPLVETTVSGTGTAPATASVVGASRRVFSVIGDAGAGSSAIGVGTAEFVRAAAVGSSTGSANVTGYAGWLLGGVAASSGASTLSGFGARYATCRGATSGAGFCLAQAEYEGQRVGVVARSRQAQITTNTPREVCLYV